MADYKKSKRLAKKRKHLVEEEQVDEEVASAMGFGGFRTSKKWFLVVIRINLWWI